MRVLFACQMVPYLPCTDGFRIIPANLVKQLSPRHEIHLVALADGSEDEGRRDWSRRYCASVTAVEGARSLRLDTKGFAAARFERTLAGKLAELKPDVVHVEGSGLAPLARSLPRGPFRLLSAHDSLQLRFRDFGRHADSLLGRLRFRVLASRAGRFERRWFRHFDRVVVTSEMDRRAIRQVTDVPIGVTPNGVDLAFFEHRSESRPGRLVFTGNMSWPPNEDAAVDFVRNALPRIRAVREDVRFTIAGADPTPRVRALAAVPGVEVTGTIPDIRRPVWEAEVYVSPLRFGAGVKNKILEAMALGTPVVGTSRSFTGTAVTEGVHAIVADEPRTFADGVLRLLESPEERQALSRNGRELVEHFYEWSSISKSFESYYPRPRRPRDAAPNGVRGEDE